MYDVIIVGGGHNGLTCAAYLARAGRRVLVLEANEELGGFVLSGDVPGAPGYRMNTFGFEFPFVALKPSVSEELDLARYGLRWTRPDPHNTYLSPQGTQFSLYRDLNKTCESIARLSKKDAESYRELMSTLMGCAKAGLPYLADHPTRPSPGTLLELARNARKQRRHLLPGTRILLQTPLEIMDSFERDELKAFIAMNVATGSFRPLDEPMNTSILAYFALLHLVPLHRPVGGAGAFVDALAAETASATLITLSGELGAGKTTFTQFVAKTLGVGDIVNSPTFVIEKIYGIPGNELDVHSPQNRFSRLVHIDAYRLQSSGDLTSLGFG